MGISILKAKEVTRTVTVEYDGETADVTFYPKRVTKSFMQATMGNGHDPLDSLTETLAHLIKDWDVVDDKGKPLPATEEVMAEFPLDFLVTVSRTITAEVTPGEAGGGTSLTTA